MTDRKIEKSRKKLGRVIMGLCYLWARDGKILQMDNAAEYVKSHWLALTSENELVMSDKLIVEFLMNTLD